MMLGQFDSPGARLSRPQQVELPGIYPNTTDIRGSMLRLGQARSVGFAASVSLPFIVAGEAGQRQQVGPYCCCVDLLNQHYLWASCIWGAIASGYCIYGWRQRAMLPFLGGLAITAASFFIVSALWMSLACIALIFITHWLLKQGY